jgi:hypothetical protein
MAKKRDSGYYRERLRRDHPRIYADLGAGRYRSVRQAAIAAGLIREPTRLQALKRNWQRASPAEQRRFVAWVRARTASARRAGPSISAIVDSDNRLKPPVVSFLKGWIRAHRYKPGWIMKDLGFSVYDATLAPAITSNGPVREKVADKLQHWLAKQGFR